jgi:dimeric dUTPase (all-alpha-NTP-PPase superfamily)
LFELSNNLDDARNVIHWCQKYLELGYKLGFTLNDIKQAYIKKNEINFQRQLSNY